MSRLSKEDILNASDIDYVEVAVPEWGGIVRVSTITGQAKDKLEMALSGKNSSLDNVRARIIALCVVDDNDALMFSDADVVKLGKKSAKALERVFQAAQKLNAIGDAEVESLAKN